MYLSDIVIFLSQIRSNFYKTLTNRKIEFGFEWFAESDYFQ
jgi:hypothetical protein